MRTEAPSKYLCVYVKALSKPRVQPAPSTKLPAVARIVVSPITRATQTAFLAFQHLLMDNGFVSANKFSFAVTVKAPAVACCALGVLLAVSSDVEFDMIGIP